ncbi:MFS transporter [Gammaproteobacteria bacterium]|nr:MFS transporter [Gammaproteobacteria bacterium]|tara:strand:- start:441 stop:1637 length:1197 start_codon:yes stop_codon:yes gene_type:complete
MSDTNEQSVGLKNPFDSWKSIVISLYMTLIGYGVLVGIPVISTAWVTLLGFSEVEVGRVAGADLGGLSLGAVVTAIFISRVNRRHLVVIGLSLAVVANGLCISVVDYDQVLWLRLLSGIGSGIYTAVAVSSLGASSKPARAYNAMLFAFAFSQALEMHFLPMLSMAGIYSTFIICFLLTIPFIGWIPAHGSAKIADTVADDALSAQPIPKFVPWLCLAAMVVTYINIGAYWTYIELAAASDQADAEWVGQVLTLSSFCSLVGCLFATILSNRYGLLRPLLITLTTMAVIVGMLANGITDQNILISVFSFNCLWIFIDVYQMSTIANVDKTGRFAALMPGAQGLGQIIGPNLAASILGLNWGYSGVFMMCAGAAIVAMLLYAFMYLRFRRTIPALAYAS